MKINTQTNKTLRKQKEKKKCGYINICSEIVDDELSRYHLYNQYYKGLNIICPDSFVPTSSIYSISVEADSTGKKRYYVNRVQSKQIKSIFNFNINDNGFFPSTEISEIEFNNILTEQLENHFNNCTIFKFFYNNLLKYNISSVTMCGYNIENGNEYGIHRNNINYNDYNLIVKVSHEFDNFKHKDYSDFIKYYNTHLADSTDIIIFANQNNYIQSEFAIGYLEGKLYHGFNMNVGCYINYINIDNNLTHSSFTVVTNLNFARDSDIIHSWNNDVSYELNKSDYRRASYMKVIDCYGNVCNPIICQYAYQIPGDLMMPAFIPPSAVKYFGQKDGKMIYLNPEKKLNNFDIIKSYIITPLGRKKGFDPLIKFYSENETKSKLEDLNSNRLFNICPNQNGLPVMEENKFGKKHAKRAYAVLFIPSIEFCERSKEIKEKFKSRKFDILSLIPDDDSKNNYFIDVIDKCLQDKNCALSRQKLWMERYINNTIKKLKKNPDYLKHRNCLLKNIILSFNEFKCGYCGASLIKDKTFIGVGHHIELISENGIDSPYNIIATCPNCHEQVHKCKTEKMYRRERTIIEKNKTLWNKYCDELIIDKKIPYNLFNQL